MLITSICYANIASIGSHVARLQRPQSDDLFALAEAFLTPFSDETTEGKKLSKLATTYQKAKDLFESGDLEQSKTLLKAIPPLSSYGFQSRYILGAIDVRENQLSKANKNFESILKLKSKSETEHALQRLAQKALAFIADGNGQYAKAISLFETIPHTEYEQAEAYRALKQYSKAQDLLVALEHRLKEDPNSWFEDQPQVQSMVNNQKRLERERSQLDTAESDYKELSQLVVKSLENFKQQMEKLSNPELEIPLDPKTMTHILIIMDDKDIYSSHDIQIGSTVSFPVTYGQHALAINNKLYWVNVYIDNDGQTQFDFMEQSLGTPPKPNLSNVDQVQTMLAKTEKLIQELSRHREPIFTQTREEISNSLNQNKVAELAEETKLLSVLKEHIALIKIEIQLLKAGATTQKVRTLEQEKALKLKLPD